MKNKIKTVIKSGLLGGVIEVAVTYIITIIVSGCINNGIYYSIVPDFLEICGTEQKAVMLQALLSFVMGFLIGCSSLVTKQDTWSLLKQTLIHFSLIVVAVFPIAWICRWIQRNITGILIYIGVFIAVYTLIWIFTILPQRRRIAEINKAIDDKRD